MANILRARLNPPFGWHYAWLPLNEDGQPNIKHESALKQPETIKIRWDVPDSSRSGSGRSREVSADIIPDQGLFGCEFAMIHTFPTFEKLIKSRLDENSDEFVEQLYDLMGRCFQGKSQTKWSKVITKVAVGNRSAETFLEAQRDYLEAIAKVKNLGDCIIRQLCDRAKPAAMAFDDYVDRRDEWRRHAEGDYLRNTLAMPTQQEWAEQIFSQQPKAHQLKYAEEHDSVEQDMDKLKLFFNG